MAFYTPLRYPGGKGKLAYYLKALIQENNLLDCHYIEPFAGGAGVAFELLMQEYVRKITINDIDPAIHAFWFSVLNHTDEFCSKIMTTPVTMDTWIEQKKILSENIEYDTLELGFATFFLNRTNRSGILKAGVIGGKAQSGKWKLDVRYNKEELISRIKKIAKYKTRINLQNEDTLSLLKNLPSTADSRTLIYLDPPYYVKGQGLYRNFYNHQDHLDIQQQLEKTTNYHWLVTYDNAPEIKDMYANHNTVEFDLQYTAQAKKVGSEVMIYSDSLIVPTIDLGKQVA